MAIVRSISDGVTTISLTDIFGIHHRRGGYGGVRIGQEQLEDGAEVGGRITETYRLNVSAETVDEAAETLQELFNLLVLQHRNRTSAIHRNLYLIEQAEDEIEPRYAEILEWRELSLPDLLSGSFRWLTYIEDSGLSITREHPWRSHPPGTAPDTALTIEGPGGQEGTVVHIGNHSDDAALTHVWRFDQSLGTWEDVTVLSPGLFPPTVAVGDYLAFGFTKPGHHVVVPVGTAADWGVTLVPKYRGPAAWAALVQGTNYSQWPTGLPSALFSAAGDWVLNVGGVSDWTAFALNGVTRYWLIVEVTGLTAQTTIPEISAAPFIVADSYIDLPELEGSASPLLRIRLSAPAGGGTTPGFATVGRLRFGARDREIAGFSTHLNAGGEGLPAGWAVSYGTDTSAVAAPEYPGGKKARATFATDPTHVMRVRWTGTGKAAAYSGRLQAFLRARQIGGAVGDVSFSLRVKVGGSGDAVPQRTGQAYEFTVADNGLELLDLGTFRVPFAPLNAGDTIGADLVLELLASRVTAGVLDGAELVIMPAGVDEWPAEASDPVSDVDTGSSALRGDCELEIDAGVVMRRCIKHTAVAGADETWRMSAYPYRLKPGVAQRIYFLQSHRPAAGWNEPTALCSLGSHLAVSVYAVTRYHALRPGSGGPS